MSYGGGGAGRSSPPRIRRASRTSTASSSSSSSSSSPSRRRLVVTVPRGVWLRRSRALTRVAPPHRHRVAVSPSSPSHLYSCAVRRCLVSTRGRCGGDARASSMRGAAAMPLFRCALRRRCPCFDARCGGDATRRPRPAPWLTHVALAARASPRPGRSEVT